MISNLTIACQFCQSDEPLINKWLQNHYNISEQIVLGHDGVTNINVFQNKYPRANFFLNLLNNDFANARNNIMNTCSTDYILFLDADELLSPTTELFNLISILDNDKNIDGFAFMRLNIFGRQFIDYPNYHACLIRKNIMYINNSPFFNASPGCHEKPYGNIVNTNYGIIIHLKEEWTGNFRNKGYNDNNNNNAINDLQRKIYESNR